jgi:hypothetical protein
VSIQLQDLLPVNEPQSTPIADSLKTSIANALEVVPEGKTGAAVAYVDQDGILHGVVALKLKDHWTLWANADYNGQANHFDGAAGVRFTW